MAVWCAYKALLEAQKQCLNLERTEKNLAVLENISDALTHVSRAHSKLIS